MTGRQDEVELAPIAITGRADELDISAIRTRGFGFEYCQYRLDPNRNSNLVSGLFSRHFRPLTRGFGV